MNKEFKRWHQVEQREKEDEDQEGGLNNKLHAFIACLFSWYDMKIHTDISSRDHKEKEMGSITCYKMVVKLEQLHNQDGLWPKRSSTALLPGL